MSEHPQWVVCIDMAPNEEANENVIVKMSESFTEQAGQVSDQNSDRTPTEPHVGSLSLLQVRVQMAPVKLLEPEV